MQVFVTFNMHAIVSVSLHPAQRVTSIVYPIVCNSQSAYLYMRIASLTCIYVCNLEEETVSWTSEPQICALELPCGREH